MPIHGIGCNQCARLWQELNAALREIARLRAELAALKKEDPARA